MTTATARANADAKVTLANAIITFKVALTELVEKHNLGPVFANVPPTIVADHMLKGIALFAQTVHATEAFYAQQEANQSKIEVPAAIVGADGRPL